MGYTSHLQLQSADKARLPVTETGHRSHLIAVGTVEAFGGDLRLSWIGSTTP